MSPLFRRGLLLLLCALGADAYGRDCEALLVPDFALPGVDATTDLSYLAVVTADNFAQHRANAYPRMSRLEVQLPIARELLQKSKEFAEFDSMRAHKYAEFGFNYAREDLTAYFRRLLPVQRLDAYNTCVGASGLQARVTKAGRDFVEMALSWRAPGDTPPRVPLAKLTVSGATLLGSTPTTLDTQPTALVLARNLDVDLRVSATVAGAAQMILVPRFIAPATNIAAADAAPCAGTKKVVRAIFRQTLGREPKPAELASQTELLERHSNSVRQLVQRIVLSPEYEKTYAKGKPLKGVLKALYRNVLARDGDEGGLNSNAERFGGAAFPTIAMTFLESHEYQSRFGDWMVPGTPPSIRYCAAAK